MAEVISTLADVSTIWLVILSMIFCLIPLVLLGGMVYGMRKALIALPPVFKQGQEGMAMVADRTNRASEKVTSPFVSASARYSQLKGTLRGFTKISRRKE